ncbi:DUF4166 domain-containing protein [Variovorax robiniae]|uniref:DUF4166 domain-containing protein n=1 Tax=Variovorax robiniae TaxID=1836199 RepID=A0ABU8X5S7_9BURK
MNALLSRLPLRSNGASAPVAPLDLPALVGAAGWARLPAAVQRRFAAGHADVTYIGHMDLHCSRIGRLYARVAHLFGGPLTRINADAVPTTVRVSDNGRGGVVWERSFHRGGIGGDRIVRSTKEIGADGGLLERTDGGLSMSLDVFEEAGSLVFRSRRFQLVWGRVRIAVPALLTPGVCRVAHTDLGEGRFRFTLTMVHPLWGETFRQTGVFTDPAATEN